MVQVCYCADDFSIHPETSTAILDLIEQGVLHATSCMTQADCWSYDAQRLIHYSKQIEIGLHLNFTHPFPLAIAHFPLTQLIVSTWTRLINRRLILQSIQQQWDNFVTAIGQAPDFIDGHQHVHQFPVIREILLDFLKQQQFKGWIRNLNHPVLISQDRWKTRLLRSLGATQLQSICQAYQFPQNPYFAGIYNFQHVDYIQLNQQWLQQARDGLLIMCHPASGNLNPDDVIADARVREYHYFTSPQFKHDCQQYHIQLGKLGAML